MRHRKSNWRLSLAGMIAGALLVMSGGALIHTYALEGEWKQNEHGYWYGYSDGTYPQNQWLQIDEKWYWFDGDGYAANGWLQLNNKWYYFDESCAMLTGLQEITNAEGVTNTYYLNTNGEMLTGWHRIGADWHYFGLKTGAMMGDNAHEKGTLKGIDVSKWQGEIDWNAVKEFGIEFAFIRLGHDDHVLDPYYIKNIKAAEAVGIPAGVYFYSTATTAAESLSDAQFVIDNLQGYNISYPVAIDLEDSSQSSSMSREQITAIGKAFCDEIRKAGYTPMVYCNENWYRNYVDFNSMGDVERWIARYSDSHNENLPKHIWQAGSTTRIAGINGNVDINFGYKDYTQVITPRTASDPGYVKSAGVWIQDPQGWWYCHTDGSYSKNQWELIEGTWHWFNEAGYEAPATGWQLLENEWYYYDTNGSAANGWRMVNGSWYFMAENGKMLTGWQFINGKWYYLDETGNGAMKTGWLTVVNLWYYLVTSDGGALADGFMVIIVSWYYLDPLNKGVMLTGWQFINNNWYYLGGAGDGSMKTGWQKVGANWFYMNGSGAMAANTYIGSYYVNEDGVWLPGGAPAGWLKDNTGWWYRHGNGSYTVNGWELINGTWYHFDGRGYMQTGWLNDRGTWYYLEDSGAMFKGWLNDSGTWYYLTESGAMAKDWIQIGNDWYYLYDSGAMAENAWIGGCYVDGSGKWIK